MKKKLSAEDIQSIFRISSKMEITQSELAAAFLISQGHLSRILAGHRRAGRDRIKVTQQHGAEGGTSKRE